MRFVLIGSALVLSACGFFRDSQNEPSATVSRPVQERNYPTMTAEQWLDLSMNYYNQHKFLESIGAAQTAVYLRPDFAEAYNNMGAAYASLHLWDPAIQADQMAVRIKPDFQLARNNLAWATEQKRLGVH